MKTQDAVLKAVPQQSEAIRGLWPEALRRHVSRYRENASPYVGGDSAYDFVYGCPG